MGEFITFPSKGLQLFHCWKEESSQETQHPPSPLREGNTAPQPVSTGQKQGRGVLLSLGAGAPWAEGCPASTQAPT